MKQELEQKEIDRETKILLLKALERGTFEPSDIEHLCKYLDLSPNHGFKGFQFLDRAVGRCERCGFTLND